ncbi:NACHT C-terminal alpha/beta 1 domain-containing protein [Microcoleus sp. A6-C5]|uniref:NACHT C-terminal alpha/beta 1 domain-containing protein n=1 Tax=Microcoleus sp. A6-C5 TaxID=2818547 RepID=UPI003FA5DC11
MQLHSRISSILSFSSASLLKTLSKCDRAICIVCETEDIPLQTFSPSQPNLIAEIVTWISEMIE